MSQFRVQCNGSVGLLNFPMFDLAKCFYKIAVTAGSSWSEIGMTFSKQELLKFFKLVTKLLNPEAGSCEHQQIPSRTQKFSMLIGLKLDLVNRP